MNFGEACVDFRWPVLRESAAKHLSQAARHSRRFRRDGGTTVVDDAIGIDIGMAMQALSRWRRPTVPDEASRRGYVRFRTWSPMGDDSHRERAGDSRRG